MEGGALAPRRGCVAGNLIAAFVTGADGNFDAVIKNFIPFEFDSIFSFFYTLSICCFI